MKSAYPQKGVSEIAGPVQRGQRILLCLKALVMILIGFLLGKTGLNGIRCDLPPKGAYYLMFSFKRIEDDIELSWGDRVQPGAETAAFIMEDGLARASVDDVANALFSAVEWFLKQDEVKESHWGSALTTHWREISSKPAGISALSWYLDSSPEAQSLTEKFKNALDELRKPLSLTEKSWWGNLSPEVAMFGDLSPNISQEAAVSLLVEYFDALTETANLDELEKLVSEEPAWTTSFPWQNGYSLALDVLDGIDPETRSPCDPN